MAERSIHEMLKDAPSMNLGSSIHSGTEAKAAMKHPNNLPLRNITTNQSSVISPTVCGTATPSPLSPTSTTLNGVGANELTFIKNGASKIDTLKNWSISTYKCTRQIMMEKLGKSTRTVDSELESQIEQLRDTQRKYLSILRLSRSFSSHFHHCIQTQHQLSEIFSDLAQKSPELQQEFLYNSETQRNLTKNGEILLNALNFFISSVNTLCNKTIEDTLLTIKQYETARIEYDAYRTDLELSRNDGLANTPSTPTATATATTLGEENHTNFAKHKEQYEKLRSDVAVKMQFLDENRVSAC